MIFYIYVIYIYLSNQLVCIGSLQLVLQYLKAQNAATPARHHLSLSAKLTCMFVSDTNDFRRMDSVPDGNSIHMTKLVECPVVLSIPARRNSL